MVYRLSKIAGISITSVGVVLAVFALWAMFITTIPVEQFQEDPKYAIQYMEYYQALTIFGGVMIISGGFLYFLHRRSLKEIERECKK